MSINYLSDEQCQIILQNRFNAKNIKFLSSELIAEDVVGYVGEYYKLTLTYEINGKISNEVLFLKKKPSNTFQAEAADSCNVYEKEILFYDILQKEFEKRGYDTSFAAKSFYCISNEAIIMQHLNKIGYTSLEKYTFFNLNKMKCALKALALYHGAGFAYEKSKSEELGKMYKFTDDYEEIMVEKVFCQYLGRYPLTMQFWEGCSKTLSCLIDLLPKHKEYKDEFKTLLNYYKLGKIFVDKTNLPKTCGHGDLWSNNMMFKFAGNNATECCLLDFQILRYFYPAFDIILAIYCNTDSEFREKHLFKLYTYYYDTLSEVLNNYGYKIEEIITLEEYYSTLHLVKVDALTQVTYTNAIIYIPKDNSAKSRKVDDKIFKSAVLNNSEKAVKGFQTNEIFRKILSELLYDLRDELVSRKNEVIKDNN